MNNLNQLLTSINEIYSAFKEPITYNNRQKSKNYSKLILLLVLNIIAVNLLVKIFYWLFDNNLMPRVSKEVLKEPCTYVLFFLMIILSIVVEELKYRLILGSFKYRNVLISISFLLAEIVVLSFYNSFVAEYDCYLALYYLIVFCFTLIIYFGLKYMTVSKTKKINNVFNKYYNIIFFSSIILFSVWHVLLSYSSLKHHYSLVFLIFFINGFIFTIVRVKYGIYISMLYHLGYNMPFIITNIIALYIIS